MQSPFTRLVGKSRKGSSGGKNVDSQLSPHNPQDTLVQSPCPSAADRRHGLIATILYYALSDLDEMSYEKGRARFAGHIRYRHESPLRSVL